MKTLRITTNNRELYEKFNLFNFVNEIAIDKKLEKQIKLLIKNINRNNNLVSIHKAGNYIVVKRRNPFNITAYLR